jgi:predicted aspartyl protease
MNTRSALAGLLLFSFAPALSASPQSSDQCIRDPFALKTAVSSGTASAFCAAVLAADEQSEKLTKRELSLVIRRNPGSEDSYQAHSNLFSMYFREGQYRRADKELDQMLAEKPGKPDTLAVRSLVQALSRMRRMSVSARKASSIRSEQSDGNLHIPITINSRPATYIVDTGANVSLMSESEATRLGLTVANSSSTLTDISGAQTGTANVTDARDLTIGRTRIRNVAFIVLPDSQEPFVDLPEEQRGILGLPVLMALGSFRIDRNGIVTIAPPERETSPSSSPLAFVDLNPVTQVGFAGQTLTFTFDTGATSTTLNPAFGRLFPATVKEGTIKSHKLTGLGGSTEQISSVVPSLTFEFGRHVNLISATVFLSDGNISQVWAAGNLGFDLMQQALPMTIDFTHMRIEF